MIQKVEHSVCNAYGISTNELRCGGTQRIYSTARAMTWYILHYKCGLSARAIANEYNRSDRGVKQMIANMKFQLREKDTREKFDKACNEIEKTAEP